MSRHAVCRMEGGAWLPNTAVALRLAAVLKVPVEELFAVHDVARSDLNLATETDARVDVVELRRRHVVLVADEETALQPQFRLASCDSLMETRGNIPANAAGSVLLCGCDPAFGVLADLLPNDRMTRLVTRTIDSTNAISRLAEGQTHLAGIHLIEEDHAGRNAIPASLEQGFPHGLRVVEFARWEQGVMLAPGNPLGVRMLADLARPDLRFANRPIGSGCRAQFDAALARSALPPSAIPNNVGTVSGHWATATLLSAGTIDAGLGLRAVAQSHGLHFLPIGEVRCDLLVPLDLLDHPSVAMVLDLLNRSRCRRALAALAGYNSDHSGRTVAEVPVNQGGPPPTTQRLRA